MPKIRRCTNRLRVVYIKRVLSERVVFIKRVLSKRVVCTKRVLSKRVLSERVVFMQEGGPYQ